MTSSGNDGNSGERAADGGATALPAAAGANVPGVVRGGFLAAVGTLGRSAAWLTVEFMVLFVGLPVLVALRVVPMRALIPTLMALALLTGGWLLLSRGFERRRLWRVAGVARELPRLTLTFVVGAAIMAAVIALHPDLTLFELPQQRPAVWLAVMVLYPVFSVLPQEVICRAFVHHRYRRLGELLDGVAGRANERWGVSLGMVGLSAAAFGIAHAMFPLPVMAVVLSAAGGLLFAWTYERTRSVPAAWLEHALFGCWAFTVGLNGVFYRPG